MTPQGVVDADGVEREVDVLVLVNRVPADELPRPSRGRRPGRASRSTKYWDGEPRAFLGVTVPTFPNFYMLYGPGTNGGEIALNLRQPSRVRAPRR